jgi:hypothetical protein
MGGRLRPILLAAHLATYFFVSRKNAW